ncbi:MAG TPA: pyridoxamine 5'-phosphate oxidase family protein [Actinomycetota bacterium]
MTHPMPSDVVGTLERGSFCHVAAATRFGPHLTPMVFVLSGDRLWVTTSRGSVKARAWRTEPRVGGLVRAGDASVAFTGRARPYDLLDVDSWERGIRRTPALAAASIRFTRKNARFFAGYAVDAHRVPLSWTPPGRVFVEIEMERGALVDRGGLRVTWGGWPTSLVSRASFRASRSGAHALGGLPQEIVEALGRSGRGVLAVDGEQGPVALPASWALDGPELYASALTSVLELATLSDAAPEVALAMDRPSWWRARRMVGAMVQGRGEIAVPERLRSGAGSAIKRLALMGSEPGRSLVRVRPRRLVWWQGWTSGSSSTA